MATYHSFLRRLVEEYGNEEGSTDTITGIAMHRWRTDPEYRSENAEDFAYQTQRTKIRSLLSQARSRGRKEAHRRSGMTEEERQRRRNFKKHEEARNETMPEKGVSTEEMIKYGQQQTRYPSTGWDLPLMSNFPPVRDCTYSHWVRAQKHLKDSSIPQFERLVVGKMMCERLNPGQRTRDVMTEEEYVNMQGHVHQLGEDELMGAVRKIQALYEEEGTELATDASEEKKEEKGEKKTPQVFRVEGDITASVYREE